MSVAWSQSPEVCNQQGCDGLKDGLGQRGGYRVDRRAQRLRLGTGHDLSRIRAVSQQTARRTSWAHRCGLGDDGYCCGAAQRVTCGLHARRFSQVAITWRQRHADTNHSLAGQHGPVAACAPPVASSRSCRLLRYLVRRRNGVHVRMPDLDACPAHPASRPNPNPRAVAARPVWRRQRPSGVWRGCRIVCSEQGHGDATASVLAQSYPGYQGGLMPRVPGTVRNWRQVGPASKGLVSVARS